MKYIFFLLLTSCTALYGREISMEDCITRHLKVVANKSVPPVEFYEKIVDSCKEIYGGRP